MIRYCWRRVFVWKIAFVHLSGSAASFVKKPHDRIQIYFRHTIVICFRKKNLLSFFFFLKWHTLAFNTIPTYSCSCGTWDSSESQHLSSKVCVWSICLLFFLFQSFWSWTLSLLWSISILILKTHLKRNLFFFVS